jgi:beta-galactosidase/beta-glucuronidase
MNYKGIGLMLSFMLPVVMQAQQKISLDSDNKNIMWKLKPQSEIGSDSVQIYAAGFDDRNWVNAVVPGAVFTSYVNAGIEKDPNWADNIYKVDQSKYNRNFWYRTEFLAGINDGEKLWLNFEGINRRGEIFLNGTRLGMLDGFMQRGKFDITGLVKQGGKNVLAVLVYWPTKPIANHASPTYISSDGWDWMPSVPGLLQGITDDVYLSVTGFVTFNDTWIRTDVPSKQKGIVSVNVDLKNNGSIQQKGVLTGTINPGNIVFTQPVHLNAGQQWGMEFNATKFKQLAIENPSLWWPNGYGEPNLYTLDLKYTVDGKTTDAKQIKFGIKKYSYDTLNGVLHLNINGERIFAKGGNWGMSEYMLRCRGEEYDLKVKLHKEMNYNIIRNWIGSVTDEEFYDACDKYGMMVWDDFWLNSHPNLPDDVMAFNNNAVEKIKRLRNHPSIAVWCGDNEGYPLPPLNGWLKENVKTFDGGDRLYQANSHSDGLTGSGPWANSHPNWYFTKYPGGFGGDPGWGFRTEIGTAVFTTFESLKKFMPDSKYWPRNQMWDKHFFGPSAANGGPDRYFKTINASYGTPTGIEDFCKKAQLVNIETNKALYEGWQHHMWNDASGVMTWMSQSAYPSFVWQTYDYYYDLNGAYWGVKKACEPVHIQWSYADNSVKISNTTLNNLKNLRAEAIVYNMDGKPVKKFAKTATVTAIANAITNVFSIDFTTENKVAIRSVTASSTASEAPAADAAIDGNGGTRWSSNYKDDEWIYVDLGEIKEIGSVMLNWESAHARAFKLQVSDDAQIWKDVYSTIDGSGGMEAIDFAPLITRYIKMQGIKRATEWGYSLFEIEVYSRAKRQADLSPVHFIKLLLRDEGGKLLSDNFYWRSARSADYTALNKLPKAKLKTTSSMIEKDGRNTIGVDVRNVGSGVAFAIHVQAVGSDGERILPAIMNDNYFTLMKGETKHIDIEFDHQLLKDGKYKLVVEAYNK